MNKPRPSTADLLASARELAQSVAPRPTPERELLSALERVQHLPMHPDVRFVHELAIAFLKGSAHAQR